MTAFFGYSHGRSFLHRLDPRPKALALLAGFLAVALFDSVPLLASVLLAILVLFLLSGTSPARLARKARGILLFGLLIFLAPVLFVREGQTLWVPFGASVLGHAFTLAVTDAGIIAGLVASLRFLDIVLMSAFFVSVTDPSRLAGSLVRSGLPYRYAYSLVLALRFAPLFADESSQVQQAQRARGLAVDSGGVLRPLRLARYTLTPLLASALGRVDAISASMESRAFGMHDKRTFLRGVRLTALDYLVSAASIAVTVLVLVVRIAPSILP